jgi:hypothetical protein
MRLAYSEPGRMFSAGPALGNAGVSDRAKASADWFGSINFSTMDAEFARFRMKAD